MDVNVKWEIDIDIDRSDPNWKIRAAVEAKRIMLDPSSIANVFKINDNTKIDLDDPKTSEDLCMAMDEFTKGYLACALWSSKDDTGKSLENYSIHEVEPGTLIKMIDDCAKFQDENRDILEEGEQTCGKAGHLFWLDRNGHGSGFLDGDYSEETGKKLHESAERFNEFDLYVGDNGRIYGESW